MALNGWPNRVQDVPHLSCLFWSHRDKLTIKEGVLLIGNRVCIPSELHDMTLYDLHNSHQGIEKITHIARANVYWPGIDTDIADYVRKCTICAKHKASQTVQPMLPWDIPDGPWQELAADYFTHKGKDYLLIVDTFSKHPFVYKIHCRTTDSIIQHLQVFFLQYGIPQHFFSDNGPHFSSDPFLQFISSHAMDHITSSPLYPRSNGFIERQLKTIKTSLTTTQSSNISIYHLLQTLHSTPIGPKLLSPCKIPFNCTNTRPVQPPTPIDLEHVRDYLITKRLTQKHYYHKRHNTRPLPDLNPRQDILFLSPVDQTSYLEGTIVSQTNTPRSYLIKGQGHRYRHNIQYIRPINTDPPSPLSRPYMHTTSQSHNNSIISAPQNISGPLQPLSEPNVQNMKIPTLNDTPWPSSKLHKTTHHNCPYTRYHSTKPSNSPHNPISGPPPQAELCLNNLPMYLISINGITQPSTKDNTDPPQSSPLPSPCPSLLNSSSTLSSQDSTLESSPSSTESPWETETTASVTSTASDRQLHPFLPIRYNKVFLKKLNGRPQITTMNNLSIPLPHPTQMKKKIWTWPSQGQNAFIIGSC